MRIFPLVFWPHIKNPGKAVSLLRKYRKVFGSDEGKAVLRDIMLQAGFGSVTRSPHPEHPQSDRGRNVRLPEGGNPPSDRVQSSTTGTEQ